MHPGTFLQDSYHMIGTKELLARLAALHPSIKEIVVSRYLPDLRIHDDGAIQPHHLIGRRRSGQCCQVVMAGDHVAPPGFLDVAFELDAERAVVPEAVQAAVDFARLKKEAAPLAQRDEFFHVHDAKSLLAMSFAKLDPPHSTRLPIHLGRLKVSSGVSVGKRKPARAMCLTYSSTRLSLAK